MSTNYLAQFSANLSTISAVNINYSTLIGSTIIASSITTNSTINVSSITSRMINYSTLMGSTLTAQLINYSTLTGSTIIGNSVSIASTIITSSILTNGNVGIGTNTPNAPLQFSNAVVNRKIVLYEDTNNDNQFFGFGVNSFILRYQVSATTVSHVFYAGTSSSASTELMRIMGTGNVGIGTATPNAKLDINSSSTTSFIMQALISGEAYALSSSLKSTYSPAGSIMTIGTTNGVASAGALIDFATQGTTGYTNVYAGGVAGSGANGPSNFVIGRRTGAVSWAESLRIDTAGNVGIATNNPGFALDVNGISATRSSFFINSQAYAPPATGDNGGAGIKMLLFPAGAGSYSYAIGIDAYKLWYSVPAAVHAWFINGTQVMTLSGAGALTIGGALTVGPAALPVANSVGTTNLIVYGNINCYRNRLIFSDAATDWNHSIYNNVHNLDNEGIWDGMKFNVYDGAWFRVGATRTTAMYINSSGSIGIGTSGPTNLLTVQTGVLEVNDGTTSGKYGIYGYGGQFFINPRTSTGGFTGVQGITMSSNGNVSVSGTLTGSGHIGLPSGDIYVAQQYIGFTASANLLTVTVPTPLSGYSVFAYHITIYCGAYFGSDIIYAIFYPRRTAYFQLYSQGSGGTSWNGTCSISSYNDSTKVLVLNMPGFNSGYWGGVFFKAIA